MIVKPYGDTDPYAELELIASSKMEQDTFVIDQMPVLSARVSHAGSGKTGENEVNDVKLMNFLAEHKHMTPFEHQSATLRVVAPIFVFREWHRHRTQAYNEVSMRYCSDPVGKFHKPTMWREQASRDKQSSAGFISGTKQREADSILRLAYGVALTSYNGLIDLGVCREQARIVVPVGNYSEMYATASLRNWFAFYTLRSDPHAQLEIRQFSDAIGKILSELWPDSWAALENSLND